jgi:hypothetical protein
MPHVHDVAALFAAARADGARGLINDVAAPGASASGGERVSTAAGVRAGAIDAREEQATTTTTTTTSVRGGVADARAMQGRARGVTAGITERGGARERSTYAQRSGGDADAAARAPGGGTYLVCDVRWCGAACCCLAAAASDLLPSAHWR